ncbi:hypothetical protein SAMN05216268_107276 [Streptomyces yunnanensis]|uniref:Uncharacterized protein n=1 Tax=Streptomyces yunnanensis TaxID=156453 RepID=A0A9X8MVJ2_9ACTN|nr:hypothetical protein SAMN05216268_107276 [Streptomyces yunnanensis]
MPAPALRCCGPAVPALRAYGAARLPATPVPAPETAV